MNKSVNAINKLSPSKIFFIDECKLRYAFSLISNKKEREKVFNKYSFIGILLHAVLEDYIKSPYSLNEFNLRWDKVYYTLLKEYNQAENTEHLKYLLPYYIIKKNKLKGLLSQISKRNLENISSEEEVSSTIVYGLADIVEKNGSNIIITDFKTGPIWIFDKGRIIGIKKSYKVQLLTYSLVYWEKGYDADKIISCLKGLSDDEIFKMKFSEKDYLYHKKFLYNLKNEINKTLQNNNIQILASPMDSACKYCKYSYKCQALHQAIIEDINNFSSFVIIDKILCAFDDQNSKINITTNNGNKSVHRIPHDIFIELKDMISNGNKIFIAGVYAMSNTPICYWTRYSTYRIIN